MSFFRLLLAAATVALLAGCTSPGPSATPTSGSTSATTSPTSHGSSTGTSSAGPSTSAPLHVHVVSSAFDAPTKAFAAGTKVDFHAHAAGHTVTIHRANSTGYLTDEAPAAEQTVSVTFANGGTYYVFCKNHSSGASGDYSHGMVVTFTVA